MPEKKIAREEIYETVDDVTTLIEVIEKEIEVPTVEEIIAEKEAKLLEMYEEIQKLKATSETNSN
jgi:hypothetical protein